MSYPDWQQPSATAGPSRPNPARNTYAYAEPAKPEATPDASPSPSPAAGGSSGPAALQGVFAQGPLVEPHQDLNDFLESFWTRQMDVVERDTPDFRTYPLPLARIKKVMKSDEVVKMISAEAPIMFSKACETEAHKRRTLQKSDVAAAIALSDMFDFLIDIVPRDDDGAGAEAEGVQEQEPDVEAEVEGDADMNGTDAEAGEGQLGQGLDEREVPEG